MQLTPLVCSVVLKLYYNSSSSTIFSPQLTDRRTSHGDVNPRTVKDTGLHQKTNNAANCPRHNDMVKAPEVPLRKPSMDTGQPQLLPSPSPSIPSRHLQPMPLPVPPQSGVKPTGRRPIVGGESLMPSNLLNELNSVLNKTGRTTKNNDWQEENKRRKRHTTVCLNDDKNITMLKRCGDWEKKDGVYVQCFHEGGRGGGIIVRRLPLNLHI